MVQHEGAGRIRLANGARMTYRAFRETMAEQDPQPAGADEPQEPEFELAAAVRLVRAELDALKRLIEPDTALRRARADIVSGRLNSNAPPQDITRHAAEVELWS